MGGRPGEQKKGRRGGRGWREERKGTKLKGKKGWMESRERRMNGRK